MLVADIQIRDPFILKHGGLFYMYGSTDKDIWRGNGVGFDVYTGQDLVNWDGPFPAFRPPEGFWGTRNFWAPEVFACKNEFFMFASFIGDGFMRGTAILKSERPTGPFLPWSRGAVTPANWMCLDGTLHIDESGEPWIVFCHEWVQVGDGTVCAARLSADLSGAVSEPVKLFSSSEAVWSRKAFSPSNNIEGYVTDGCFLHRMSGGKLLMIWSCIGEMGYCLGYAVSESGHVLGPWKQAKKPLFAEDGGHGMIFRDFEDRLMLAMHSPNKTPNERAVFVGLEETADGLRLTN
ncbi:MAG: glycoside hydrolase family 43 protein [Defluviitaleaceae bacterium]|nr:glycoside hydrolase family 43 protein [Defluviitaleaceae bacterium]MCL2836812.1 glycoside hydrolase family 43 protein [Defluviitaleaceae bacterium]